MKKNNGQEVIEVIAEELPDENKLVQEIENSLVKANVTDKVIASLKKTYGGLKLKSIDDKESYLNIKEARKEVRKVGIITEKICKKGREDAVRKQRMWLDKQNEILSRIGEIQDPLDAEIKKFDDEVERKEQEEAIRREEIYVNRQSDLIKYGAQYINGSFVLSHISYESELIKNSDDEMWNEIILPKYRKVFEETQAALVEQENKRKAELERQEKERKEFEEKQAAFRKEQEEFEKQKAEMKRIKDEDEKERNRLEMEEKNRKAQQEEKIWRDRLRQLNDVEWNGETALYWGEVVLTISELINLSEESFVIVRDAHNKSVEQSKKVAEEKRIAEAELQKKLQQQRICGKARFDSLSEIGFTNESEVNLGCMSDDDWNTMWSSYKDQYDKKQHEKWLADMRLEKELAEQKKAEELAQSSDKEKYQDIVTYLKRTPIHEMKSSIYKSKMNIIRDFISDLN